MKSEKELEREEREKFRYADFARIVFSILVLYISRNVSAVNILMSLHLLISVLWLVLSEMHPLFQRKYSAIWLVPASLDVLNCLMIIYVTGSSYSSWILSLTFITAISASDPLWWRGAFTGIAGAAGLALMLVLVQTGVLPFTDIWKINYRPNSWSLVAQTVALNAGVSFFVWAAVHKSSVIADTGRTAAENESSWINPVLKRLYSEDTLENMRKGIFIESEFSSVMTVCLELEASSGSKKSISDKDDYGSLLNFINSVINEFSLTGIFQDSGFTASCRLSSFRNQRDLEDCIYGAMKIYSYIHKENISRKKRKLPLIRIKIGITIENLSALKSEESGKIFIPAQDKIISSLKISLFGKKDGIYVSETVKEHLGDSVRTKLEGRSISESRSERIYSIVNPAASGQKRPD